MAHQDKNSKESEEENEACGGGRKTQNRLEGGPDRLLVGGAAPSWSLTRLWLLLVGNSRWLVVVSMPTAAGGEGNGTWGVREKERKKE